MPPTYPSLDGNVGIVTGAGSGIGRATAAQLDSNGVTVIGLDIAAEPNDGGPRFEDVVNDGELVVGDVSDRSDVDRATDRAREFGPVDLAVNNAGIGGHGRIEDIDPGEWRETFAIHVEGTYNLCHRLLPEMASRGAGSVVNVSSIGGIRGRPQSADYGAAKGAIANLTRQLAVDYSPEGVRINAVAPGFIKTEMNADVWRASDPDADMRSEGDRGSKTDSRISLDSVSERTLSPRLGEPVDVAHLISFLASDASGFITGHVIPVDGGLTAW